MVRDSMEYKVVLMGNEFVEIDLYYFKIIRETENYFEIMSKNTKHCWLIQRKASKDNSLLLYHKHSINIPYYHKQNEVNSVMHAFRLIWRHDDYVLGKKNEGRK